MADKTKFPKYSLLERSGVKPGEKVEQNATPQDLRDGNYKPRLTIYARPAAGTMSRVLKIEFSAPKLLFGNNFEEMADSDFDELINRLQAKLKEMGVWVYAKVLEATIPTGIHYSKNFVLASGTSTSMIISELAKANVSKRLDSNKVKFRNEGHYLSWHTNSFEVVFYDKVKDLDQSKKSEKRAIEKDNSLQLPLFEVFREKRFEVLRFEVRLNRRKLKLIAEKAGLKTGFTFRELFSSDVSLAVLRHFWQEYTQGLELAIPETIKNDLDTFRELTRMNTHLKGNRLMQCYLAMKLIGANGHRAFRQAYESTKGTNWTRLNKDIKSLKLPPAIYRPYKEISAGLEQYKPVKFADYPQLELNNDNKRYEQNEQRKSPSPYDYD